jgi:hypothetical protein
MASVNQTRPHCVNQMGKTHKPLAARHGRGKAWARHALCESASTDGSACISHRRFKISATIVLPKWNVRLYMKCEHERLFNRRGEKVAACSISRATRLSLDDSLYKQNTKKCMRARKRATIAPFSPYVIHKVPLLVGVWSSANMLAIFLPNDVSSTRRCR